MIINFFSSFNEQPQKNKLKKKKSFSKNDKIVEQSLGGRLRLTKIIDKLHQGLCDGERMLFCRSILSFFVSKKGV